MTATFVFTDLVGSTALMARVGEAPADDLRREYFSLLRAAVAAHRGREVKNTGDGLMLVFDSVVDALAGSVAMQQALAGRSPDTEPLAMRIGVASGEAESEDNDYFGLPVVEAARLCALANDGEILTTDLVRILARSRSSTELEPVGALELKGLAEPVESFRVRWAPITITVESPPLPARLASALSPTFVGRDGEQEQLLTAWKSAVGGERRLMLLSGEPGIGKTTLAAEFAARVHDDGAWVVYGRCDEDLGVPYQPWIQALGDLVIELPEPVVAAHVADCGAHLARLVPQLATRLAVDVPSTGGGDSERFVMFGCVADLLARASVDQPVLLVLDDLHWADRATVQLFRHVASAEQAMRIGIVGTFRDSDIGADHPMTALLAGLHREGGAERIALAGLDDQGLLALLERVAGHDMDDQGVDLRNALSAETAGNPFFVTEVLRHLVQTGAIYQDDRGRWASGIDIQAAGLPISVREVVGRRVAGLGADTERVLGLASVIGRDFDLGLLAPVADLDEDTVIDHCDRAVHASILQTTDNPDRYTFAHALIEHTLYEVLSPARRARAHRTIAEHLEVLVGANPGERAGELAYHWASAVQPTDNTKAIHYARLAGDRALALLAPDEAARWYGQALEFAERAPAIDQRERIELLVGLGIAQRQTGNPAHRESLLDAAHQADRNDEVDLLVRATLANNRGWQSDLGTADQERIAIIDRALERLGPAATADRARILALAAVERAHTSPLVDRLALAEEAIATARASGDVAATVSALHLTNPALVHPSTRTLRIARLDEACALADRLDDPVAQFWVHVGAFIAAFEVGDGESLDAHRTRCETLADRVPDSAVKWASMLHRACLAGLRGSIDEYERLADATLSYGIENGMPDAFGFYAGQIINVRAFQGRSQELVALIEQAADDNPGIPAFRAVLAVAKTRAGEHDDVRNLLAEAAADHFDLPEDSTWAPGIAMWTEAATLSRAADVAPLLRSMLLPYHDQIVADGPAFYPALAHYLGLLDHLLGDHDSAEKWFTEAIELHSRLRSPVLIATTNAAYGVLLADRGRDDDHARARDVATSALSAATAGGYGYVEAEARAVLDRLG